MGYTDLIFDLYGTLVDIHTEETPLVWEKCALYLGFFGARYTGESLRRAFGNEMERRRAQAGQSYECFPDIPMEEVLACLLAEQGIDRVDALAVQAAKLFRVCSMEYIRLYDGVLDALARLRKKGYRLWLLSNAQGVFTRGELKLLGLDNCFDGIYLSSDFRCRKPDGQFFRALLEGEHLNAANCLMIGNDRQTDISGAMAAGLDTLYLHTNLTPADQLPADPSRRTGHHRELEGADWFALTRLLENWE